MSQGNQADTNGDQMPDSDGDHGCFPINRDTCDRKSVYAFDFAMPGGSDVVAAAGGIVTFARSDSSQGGCAKKFAKDVNYIVVEHLDDTRTAYLHLQQNSVVVAVGDRVQPGQLLAKSGNTGWSCGFHLHFQLETIATGWYSASVPIQFSDVAENGGVPIATRSYLSGNYD